MLPYPLIDPVLLHLGPVKIHWYGMMYLISFALAYLLALRRSRFAHSPLQSAQVEDLVIYVAMGVVLGGRIGYILFYGMGFVIQDPMWMLRVWEGGMSFHGGLIGVMIAMWLVARKTERSFAQIADFVAPLVPIGLGLGRLGNFINQELWGRVADVPWAMVFPKDASGLPRHPSQLYEFFLEGIVMFAVLYWFSRKPQPAWRVCGLFVLLYGIFRFAVEFYREPDGHIGYEMLGWMTRGQELCVPMIIGGIGLMLWSRRYPVQPVTATPVTSRKAAT